MTTTMLPLSAFETNESLSWIFLFNFYKEFKSMLLQNFLFTLSRLKIKQGVKNNDFSIYFLLPKIRGSFCYDLTFRDLKEKKNLHLVMTLYCN